MIRALAVTLLAVSAAAAAGCGAADRSWPDAPSVAHIAVGDDGTFAAPRPVARRPAGPSSALHRTPQRAVAPSSAAARSNDRVPPGAAGRRIAAARALIGTTSRTKPLVKRVLARTRDKLAVSGRPYAAALHRTMSARRMLIGRTGVLPGDVVFFSKTHDLNGNSKPDDGITWAGIVDSVAGDTVVFIAWRAGRVRRMAMTPDRAADVRDGDTVLNTRLVRWPNSSRPLTAGECFTVAARP